MILCMYLIKITFRFVKIVYPSLTMSDFFGFSLVYVVNTTRVSVYL